MSVSQLYAAEDRAVTVYVMDNGIRADHRAFEGMHMESVNLVSGADVGVRETERYGDHATLMAGLIVERASSSVKLISVRTLDRDESGSWADFLKGVHWITNHHEAGEPAVANLSLGGMSQDIRIRNIVSGAISQLVEDGVTVVVAAGNEGQDILDRIPSTLASVVSVGAVSRFNFRLYSSNYGSCVDVYVKGENIPGPGSRSPKARIRRSGTSVAAAIVAGNIASYLSKNPDVSQQEVRDWVMSNCVEDRVTNLGRRYRKGNLLFLEP